MKLTIELIPKTCFYSNVRSKVSTSQWNHIKSIVGSKAYYICQICSGVGPKHPVEIHEIWDFDDNSLVQKLIGMIALCPLCHCCKHIGLAQIQGKYKKALAHLMKINKISKNKAQEYIKECFIIWEQRSQKEWTLDISILEEYGI